MNTENAPKLKSLITNWPRGVVYATKYLRSMGYRDELLQAYKKNGWIVPIERGAYKLAQDKIDWRGGVFAIQNQLNLPVHIGGKTLLELKGFYHYIAPKRLRLFLYGDKNIKLPKWFTTCNWDLEVVYVATSLFPPDYVKSKSKIDFRENELITSSVERAAFEMLYHIPTKQGYDEAQKIMDSLLTLRPTLVQELLEKCTSVKVKRLFMVMAEAVNAPWLERVDLSKVNFGQGDRRILPNGEWNKKYRISVPPNRDV